MLTKPTEGMFNRLTLKINASSGEDSSDLFPVSLSFDPFAVDNLNDEDIDAIAAVVAARITADHPEYTVFQTRSWTGVHNDPQQNLYTPPAPPTEGMFNRLTLKINASSGEDSSDLFPVSLSF
ncbi:hypothetical protein, partial [Streptomyces pseudovenezuelae]|uniref:hypothetical protein n=1 Tax=Streptomyces pseudovenezuelae TaxID=67350 RepID=UPI0036E6A3AD